jgi:hypothetical protein
MDANEALHRCMESALQRCLNSANAETAVRVRDIRVAKTNLHMRTFDLCFGHGFVPAREDIFLSLGLMGGSVDGVIRMGSPLPSL